MIREFDDTNIAHGVLPQQDTYDFKVAERLDPYLISNFVFFVTSGPTRFEQREDIANGKQGIPFREEA